MNRISLGESTKTVTEEAGNQKDEMCLQGTSSQKRILANLVIIVCILVFAAHLPALSAKAILIDDDQYLARNVLVQNPSWSSARRFITEVLEPSSVSGYYQPLTMISLMSDYALGGRPYNLKPFHRTSLLLHMANTALIIILVYLLFGQVWIAAGVGLLFGVHPMTVECVSWVSQRKTVLSAFFALWSLILYVRFARTNGWKPFVGCLVMYVLALMSKPTATPLPVLMLLLDYWPLRRLKRQAVLEKLPLFLVGGIFAIVIYVSQSRTFGVTLPAQYGPRYIPLVFCHNIVFYLCKIIWPVNLSPYYAYTRPMGLSDPMVLAGIIGICILVNLLILTLRRSRGVLTSCLFFFVALLPTLGIIRFARMITGDRHVYLPSIGLLMLLALLLGWFCGTGSARKAVSRRVAAVMLVLALAGAEAAATRKYLAHWFDGVTLYKRMLKLNPRIVLLHNDLGVALLSQGKLDEAANQFRQVLQIAPRHVRAHVNLGNVLLTDEKFDEAISHYRQALQTEPAFAEAHYHLAVALMRAGKFDEAIKHFREAVRLTHNPPWYFLHGLAWILATHPDPEVRDANEAIQLAKRAEALTFTKYDDMRVLDTLAAAYAATDQFDLAVSTVQEALDLVSPAHQDEVTKQIRERLELYKQGKPYRLKPSERKT
ncbi:MAG: tetratricopeptide repeat protein [Planctomycetota bacterium]